MPIRVCCPHCSASLQVDDRFAGKQGKCPKCKQTLTIVAPPASAPPRPVRVPKQAVPPPLPVSQPRRASSIAAPPVGEPAQGLASIPAADGPHETHANNPFDFTQSPAAQREWPSLPFTQTVEFTRFSLFKLSKRFTLSIESPERVVLAWQNLCGGRDFAGPVEIDLIEYKHLDASLGETFMAGFLRTVILIFLCIVTGGIAFLFIIFFGGVSLSRKRPTASFHTAANDAVFGDPLFIFPDNVTLQKFCDFVAISPTVKCKMTRG